MAGTRISRAEDILHPLQHTIDEVRRQLQQLSVKQDDMENRLRRCNLRFIGLPESTEGTDSAGFLKNLLTTTYGRGSFSVMFAVERMHRIPARPPPQGAPPCTLIAKFLNFKDRDKILRLTREKGNIPYTNVHRWKFYDVKRRLRTLHIKYAMLYSAKLRVECDGRVQFFEDPEYIYGLIFLCQVPG